QLKQVVFKGASADARLVTQQLRGAEVYPAGDDGAILAAGGWHYQDHLLYGAGEEQFFRDIAGVLGAALILLAGLPFFFMAAKEVDDREALAGGIARWAVDKVTLFNSQRLTLERRLLEGSSKGR